jgi:hypothetical protein
MKTLSIINASILLLTLSSVAIAFAHLPAADVKEPEAATEGPTTNRYAGSELDVMVQPDIGGIKYRDIPLDLKRIVTLADLEGYAGERDGSAERFSTMVLARQENLRRLHEYAMAGNFPRNTTDQQLTPVFVDENNVPCAVGHLMRESGAGDLVERIRELNNLINLSDEFWGPLYGDVRSWVSSSGLTLQECALIQPSYCWRMQPDPRPPAVSRMDSQAQLIASRLFAVHDKLAADSVRSLMQQFEHNSKNGAGWIDSNERTHRIITNEHDTDMLVRVSHFTVRNGRGMERDHSLAVATQAIGEWKVLKPGQSVLISPRELANKPNPDDDLTCGIYYAEVPEYGPLSFYETKLLRQ